MCQFSDLQWCDTLFLMWHDRIRHMLNIKQLSQSGMMLHYEPSLKLKLLSWSLCTAPIFQRGVPYICALQVPWNSGNLCWFCLLQKQLISTSSALCLGRSGKGHIIFPLCKTLHLHLRICTLDTLNIRRSVVLPKASTRMMSSRVTTVILEIVDMVAPCSISSPHDKVLKFFCGRRQTLTIIYLPKFRSTWVWHGKISLGKSQGGFFFGWSLAWIDL